ncbi:hypothetical protein CS399_06200 [Fusobacterium vincentii]|nr:hypothetical protein CS399_06200 [Fusobacterium vincentii]
MNEVSLVNLQRILDFLSLRNLASNELFFILFISLQQPLYLFNSSKYFSISFKFSSEKITIFSLFNLLAVRPCP